MELIKYDDKKTIEILKATVAVGTTDAEFAMFVGFCQSTGLNPFKREIWCIKSEGYTNRAGKWIEGKVQIMTGIAGFRLIANTTPAYDGIEIGLVGKGGEYLPATYPGKDFIGAWAKCYRKDRRMPTEGIAMIAEYAKDFGNWRTMPRVMIMKCAESNALRQSFPQQLNGLYTPEEMPQEYSEPATVKVPAKTLAAPVVAVKTVPPADLPPPPADVAAHVIESICKFRGKSIEQAYDADPEWVFAAVDNPKRLAKCLPIDQAALVEFVRLVRTDIRQTVESSLNKTLETEEKV